ncbi:ATP-binding protein [Bordetella genomosp. 13]|uniref:ATP-binding protein n=1 Tax=Bordetella genomosp. 13 TaxID=463040 RepID=UPI0011A78C17|nr:ATP-binding protein [Bordetella genomosp. 13]
MTHRILSTRISSDHGLVAVRDRTRQVGEVFGLDGLQRTRLVTAVSEIARNAVDYAGGGRIDFLFREARDDVPQSIVVEVTDEGPGIKDLASILAGPTRAGRKTRLGMAGAQRLVDQFDVVSTPQGTQVTLEMRLGASARVIEGRQLSDLVEQLSRRRMQTPVEELEQQNREMLLALDELRVRQTELELADERKDEFLAMLAHELRNPLFAITTALGLLKLKKSPSEADIRKLTDLMTRQTDQLARLVNDLLDASRVTRGKISLTQEPMLVGELIDQALEMTSAAINAKQHRVEYTRCPDLWINADRVRFRQILSNVLHNAARYTPAGGVIRIAVQTDDEGQVRIAVRDNGIGIDAGMLPRVFDLFVQADTGLGRQDAGLGIGLTLVHSLARAHGGSVTVASEGLGLGSEFTLVMPLIAAPQASAVAAAEPQAPVRGLRILLIDDNADAVQSLGQLLETSGHVVTQANTGRHGIDRAAEFLPDVVVIDIGLPDMTGFDVANTLRQTPHGSRATLVALSGYTAMTMKERGREAGFDHYLIKPVDMPRFEALLRGLAQPQPAART